MHDNKPKNLDQKSATENEKMEIIDLLKTSLEEMDEKLLKSYYEPKIEHKPEIDNKEMDFKKTALEEIGENSCINYECGKSSTHIKKNNFDENTAGSENAEENITVTRGLCFMCTQNIYFINMGIKCQLCQRTYHKMSYEKKFVPKVF
jgi:hypothetical protein